MKIVATTSLPAVDRPNADRWNAARSRQYVHVTYPRAQSTYSNIEKLCPWLMPRAAPLSMALATRTETLTYFQLKNIDKCKSLINH